MGNDLRYALRGMARSPLFTTIAIVTLALGVGVNTGLYTVLDALVNRPADIHEPDRLVWVTTLGRQAGRPFRMSYPDYLDFRDHSGVFAELATMGDARFSLATGGEPERVRGQFVSANLFHVVGATFALGRGFVDDEDRVAGDPRVVVISNRLWVDRFHANPDVIGRQVTINGQLFAIVGVAAAGFNGADHGELRALWVPIAARPLILPSARNILDNRSAQWLLTAGRLAPGVSMGAANAAFATIAANIARLDSAGHFNLTAQAYPFTGGLPPGVSTDVVPVALLGGIATFLVLLIACANVSSLLLGRSVARRREIAIRLALGASRARVVRQLLIEHFLMAAAATAAGLLLSSWSTAILGTIVPNPLDVSVRPETLLFSVGAAVVTTLLFGLVPALTATRPDVANAIKAPGSGVDLHPARLQNGFVAAQVALSLVLLLTAGLFLSAAYKSGRIDAGFETRTNVLVAGFDLGLQGYAPERATTFVDRFAARVSALPGVQSISFTNVTPMGGTVIGANVAIETPQGLDSTRFSERAGMEAYTATVRPAFFATLGIPLLQGRDFDARDVPGNTRVAIVSETFANHAWPKEDPIGKRIRADDSLHVVIGVARDAMTAGVGTRQAPVIYFAQRQRPSATNFALLMRTAGDARPLAPLLRQELHALDPALPVYGIQSLAAYRRDSTEESRLGSALLAILGALALLLAAVGVSAVVGFAVSQRTREIGVRIALGAGERDVVGMFVKRGLRVTATGTVIGLMLGAIMAKGLSSVFLGVAALDAIPFAVVALLLLGVAAFASWIPARRAARVDAVHALRAE